MRKQFPEHSQVEQAWHTLWTAHLNLEGHQPGTQYFAERLGEVEEALKVYEQVIRRLRLRAGVAQVEEGRAAPATTS